MAQIQHEFIETKIATKFGKFNIRVYAGPPNKETMVLFTDSLEINLPVLVRVHSECITGDLIGSLHCDCGKQLNKSLEMLQKEGGVLIYLRQEGRGIGLFEKMKAYQLQSQGHDTFEANILLGHRPDERTYEVVKTVLSDLNIQAIRLLTNNPSKVSEIAKQGIEIVERVPLFIKPNKYNKFYYETKKSKFQHFLNKKASTYFYQFPLETVDQVRQIGEFIKDKKRDPLLKLFVGISGDHGLLNHAAEIARIHSIHKECENYRDFIPVLHFSFRHSPDIRRDIEEIKSKMSFVKRLQLNDLPALEVNTFKKAFDLFSVDMPLSNENFDLVHSKQFRKLIEKNGSFILLDNSKGRGIKESKESLMKKVDTLLVNGLNNIALCGGFGPDKLDTYFEIRRYYRINLSIDTETNLKTGGKIDLEKIKLYLLQLIRFDDPKQQGIEQTRKFLEQHRRPGWETIKIDEKEFLIHPQVFHAGYFPSTSWFASQICELVKNDSSFCEVGCGSGVISCLAALSNPQLLVTATDINPFASENTKLNAERLGLSKRIAVLTGDVLDSVEPESAFDSIFWALPFGFLDPGTPINFEEAQVFDPGYRAISKFFQSARKYLKPRGKLLIGFSTDLGHFELLEELAEECSIKLSKVKEKVMEEESEIKFELFEGRII